MPTIKKRVNLSIPDEVYERLQAYKAKQGISNDAAACLQLIVKQLNGEEKVEKLLDFISGQNVETLNKLSQEGISTLLEVQKRRNADG